MTKVENKPTIFILRYGIRGFRKEIKIANKKTIDFNGQHVVSQKLYQEKRSFQEE